jgi:3-phenylpropionate/trans-cinnamate dioxygenase ferredoxin subunit
VARWIDALAADQLPEGGRWFVRREGHEIALFRVGGQVRAVADSCPHAGASLFSGRLDGTTLQCRAHGLRFDLNSGRMCGGGGGLELRCYAVREHEARIEIELDDAAAAAADSAAEKQP